MITICHPSRGRPEKARKTHDRWTGYALNKDIQYILSLDEDDPYLPKYKSMFQDCDVIVHMNNNLVRAVNMAIPYIKGDLVVLVSDDFDCPQMWDIILEKAWENKCQACDTAIYVNDGITWGDKCMTIPILSKSLIDKLGYIYFTRYTGLHADNDLYEVCEKLNVLIPLDVIFQHNHYTAGKAQNDATYRRHNTKQGFDYGQKIINERRAANFNL